ncbi:MT-A70 family methyltransferase [Lichenihabitans psoromatis]|uniref:MT-A70 family methyltransferase n=1 Tax=Lichenihabitans psoromatis TaxID=2528642 RepID=UPI001FE1E950|nr:MT-A70 family methyltransferase [Lichenihabitans psoromatis]
MTPDPNTFFDPLPILSYDVIMADPPWLFELHSDNGADKAPQGQYDCMPTAEICALPVSYLARGDCYLWLWATFPMIEAGLTVLKAWGFTYVTGGAWVKRGTTGKLAFGPGFVLRGNAEPFLIGRVGRPKTVSRSILNVIEAPRRRHSEKPELAYATAEQLFGPGRRADLFSRKTRPGWDAWGREAGKFDEAQPANCKREKQARPPKPLRFEHPDQTSILEVTA